MARPAPTSGHSPLPCACYPPQPHTHCAYPPVKKPGVMPAPTPGVAPGPSAAGVSSQRVRGFLTPASPPAPTAGVSPPQAGVAPPAICGGTQGDGRQREQRSLLLTVSLATSSHLIPTREPAHTHPHLAPCVHAGTAVAHVCQATTSLPQALPPTHLCWCGIVPAVTPARCGRSCTCARGGVPPAATTTPACCGCGIPAVGYCWCCLYCIPV